jgi:DNA-binding NtrC family response regulator
MTEHRRASILVVDANGSTLVRTVHQLAKAGYDVVGVDNFGDAKARLETAPPDLLITGVRLGPFNGLHLIVRSRGQLPEMATILTHDSDDPVLVGEALSNDARFLLQPCGSDVLLQTVQTSLVARSLAAPSGRLDEKDSTDLFAG